LTSRHTESSRFTRRSVYINLLCWEALFHRQKGSTYTTKLN